MVWLDRAACGCRTVRVWPPSNQGDLLPMSSAPVRVEPLPEGVLMVWPEGKRPRRMFFPWEFIELYDDIMDGGLPEHKRYPACVRAQLISFKASGRQ